MGSKETNMSVAMQLVVASQATGFIFHANGCVSVRAALDFEHEIRI